uniref:Putative LRR receptor-like serine/threonine-protein kinase n=1 Tax=Aegilops tauschii TaxID=37682 RepID=R7W3U4_AEGTA
MNVTFIAQLFGISDYRALAKYNRGLPRIDYVTTGDRVDVPFPCKCLARPSDPASTYLAASIPYRVVTGETYASIASNFNNLTTADWLQATNSYPPNNIPDDAIVNATVNCSCGDAGISTDYSLFRTFPLRDWDTLASVAATRDLSSPEQMDTLRRYNPGMDGATGSGIVYIPAKGKKVSAGAIAGSVVAGVVAPVLGVLLFLFYRRRKAKQNALRLASTILMQKVTSSATQADVASLAAGITVDKSVEFTYQELFNATEGFNITHKIGQGGFGAVYYAELVGEVRLIGYCTESSLFLVYEFVENGNLSQHLRGTDYEPLSWAERVRIALDSARGLEYIHEHTVPVYIHRDIKSANILIDKNTRAKVADFGLTKLTEVGGASLQTRVVGTFGYMPPEVVADLLSMLTIMGNGFGRYVRYGDISRKVDVYAFGVVLYELISGKDAIVRPTDGSASGSRGLVYLFEEALTALDPKEGLQKLIDPKLGDDYPVDAILMMTHLANACTEEDPKLRPTMRSVVVALMTLSSMSEFWDMKNPGLVNLMSGR